MVPRVRLGGLFPLTMPLLSPPITRRVNTLSTVGPFALGAVGTVGADAPNRVSGPMPAKAPIRAYGAFFVALILGPQPVGDRAAIADLIVRVFPYKIPRHRGLTARADAARH